MPAEEVKPEQVSPNAPAEAPVEKAETESGTKRVGFESLATFGAALIVHSVIEGMATGVYDNEEEMALLAVSIFLHKIPVAYSVGSTFRG